MNVAKIMTKILELVRVSFMLKCPKKSTPKLECSHTIAPGPHHLSPDAICHSLYVASQETKYVWTQDELNALRSDQKALRKKLMCLEEQFNRLLDEHVMLRKSNRAEQGLVKNCRSEGVVSFLHETIAQLSIQLNVAQSANAFELAVIARKASEKMCEIEAVDAELIKIGRIRTECEAEVVAFKTDLIVKDLLKNACLRAEAYSTDREAY